MDILNRARGALLGMAVGEALGAPLDGLSPEEIEEKVGRIDGFLDPADTQPAYRSGYFTHRAYEDETQVALATAETLVEDAEFQAEGLRSRLEELGRPVEGNAFGCYRRARRNFRTAVRRMLEGAPWQECGVNTAGAGAASRGIPIGIWYRDERDGRLRASVEATLLTHRDPRACAATVSVAEAVAVALAAETSDALRPEAAASAIAASCRDAERLMEEEYSEVLYPGYEPYLHQYSDSASLLSDLVQLDIGPAFERIVKQASEKGSRPITSATRGFSLTAVVSSLYLFLTGLESFEDTVLDTICEGGSADTLGCLVGGLSGALHGVDGIPAEWRGSLKNNEHVDAYGAALVGEGDRAALAPLALTEASVTLPAPPGLRKRSRRRPDPRPSARGRGGAGRRKGGGGPSMGGGRGGDR